MRMKSILLVGLAVVAGGCAADPPVIVAGGTVYADAGHMAAALDREVACLDAGASVMGRDAGGADEGPVHIVMLDPFCIARFEVTNAQYARYQEVTAARVPPQWESGEVPGGTEALPVVGVDWEEAASYCEWIGGRLPTEAEWERACRGTDGSTYPWGEEWDPGLVNAVAVDMPEPAAAWPGAAGEPQARGAALRVVGSNPAGATPEGVHDLCGNAAEWVADWYDPDAYATLPSTNPVSTGPPWSHVVRGGAWLIPRDMPGLVAGLTACAARDASHADQSARIGFRCAFDAAP